MRGFSILVPVCARPPERKTPKTSIGGVAFSVVPSDFFGFFSAAATLCAALLPCCPMRFGDAVLFADISVTFTATQVVGQCGADGIQQHKKFCKVGTGGAFPFPHSCHVSDTFLPLHKTFFPRPDAGLRTIVNQMTFL